MPIHLYPNARRVRVHHNVMDRNGGGVIFAGDSSYASVDNVVEDNVITGSFTDYNVSTTGRRRSARATSPATTASPAAAA